MITIIFTFKFLLADLFENVLKICHKIYEFDSARCFSCTRFNIVSKVDLKQVTNIGMLLMIRRVSELKYFMLFRPYVKTNNKYMKDYDKNKESLYLKYWDVNNLYEWEMPQELPVGDFKWV